MEFLCLGEDICDTIDEREVTTQSIPMKPLNFDLTQPASTSMFDSILASAAELESFQNMSPPSLVNSMCSSTFTNLMENSYIKNDPVLREIRDTDFSESVLMQESGGSTTFRSFTGSCNSLGSEEGAKYEEDVVGKTEETMIGSVDGSVDETLNEYYSPVGKLVF